MYYVHPRLLGVSIFIWQPTRVIDNLRLVDANEFTRWIGRLELIRESRIRFSDAVHSDIWDFACASSSLPRIRNINCERRIRLSITITSCKNKFKADPHGLYYYHIIISP